MGVERRQVQQLLAQVGRALQALLQRLGIDQRAAALARNATPQQARDIASARARLIAERDPTDMGRLFKAIAITRRDAHRPPGFEMGAIA